MQTKLFRIQAGYSLVEVMIATSLTAVMGAAIATFTVNSFQEARKVTARSSASNDLMQLGYQVERQFLTNRGDENKKDPNPCVKPALNFLRLPADVLPTAAQCNGITNTSQYQILADVPPEQIPGSDSTAVRDAKLARNNRMVFEQKDEDGTIQRTEYTTVCVDQAPNGHVYKNVENYWGYKTKALDPSCDNSPPGEVCTWTPDQGNAAMHTYGCMISSSACAGPFLDTRNYAVLVKKYRGWNDAKDWVGDSSVGAPAEPPAADIACLPKNYFEYDRTTKRCKFRPSAGATALASSTYGIAFCAWSNDMKEGSQLNVRIFAFLQGKEINSTGSLRRFKTEVLRKDFSFNRLPGEEYIISDFIIPPSVEP